jgi:hypothetical protein
MIVYGLDFTSSPSRKSATGESAKWLTLANCRLTGTVLKVETLTRLNAEAASDFSEYENWLNTPGEWVAGIDFSFGMPVAAIEHFGWLSNKTTGTWADYIRCLYDQIKDMAAFEATIEGWVYPNEVSESGNPIKIQPKRIADQLAHSQSPLKVNDNPHPGKMFFRGCKALLESNVTIPPLRCLANSQPDRVAVEAYPRLVAQRFFPEKATFRETLDSLATLSQSVKKAKLTGEEKEQAIVQSAALRLRLREMLRYKETKSEEAKANRKRIIEGLAEPNAYGVTLDVGDFGERCVDDPKGDVLDSVLCAVQAAWAHSRRAANFGIPIMEDELLKGTLALEGWIVDPAMQNFGSKRRRESEGA